MNPRVSRSSALASKATGYPIAKVAAKLAVGYTLDEIPNDLTKTTPASFEPTLDYVVVKFPRFAFEKFPGRGRHARHPDEVGRRGDGHRPHVHGGVPQGLRVARARPGLGDAVGDVRRHPGRRPSLVQGAARPRAARARLARHPARQAGRLGRRLDRRRLGDERRRRAPRALREGHPARPTAASTRARERSTQARTTTTRPGARRTRRCAPPTKPRVVIIGSGPNRIGQGIEFDYCCVHAVQTFRALGYEAVMINCNPETVSTDYDTSDRLYFEPLSPEEVLAVLDREQPAGRRDAVRRPDAAPARPAHRGGGLLDHGHAARRDRPRGGQGAVRRPGRRARHPLPAVGDRRGRRAGARGRCRDRLSGARPTVVRARRPGHARVLRRRAAAPGDERRLRLGARRPLRRERGRDRRRRPLRR